jgi:hypothetical protein
MAEFQLELPNPIFPNKEGMIPQPIGAITDLHYVQALDYQRSVELEGAMQCDTFQYWHQY